jgi:hypothetical protein
MFIQRLREHFFMGRVSCLDTERVKFIKEMILIVIQHTVQMTQLCQPHQIMNFRRKNGIFGNDRFESFFYRLLAHKPHIQIPACLLHGLGGFQIIFGPLYPIVGAIRLIVHGTTHRRFSDFSDYHELSSLSGVNVKSRFFAFSPATDWIPIAAISAPATIVIPAPAREKIEERQEDLDSRLRGNDGE